MELTNNTILITGGTSGFGLEFTKRLLQFGNTVIITGTNQSKLDETKRLLANVHTFQSDVSDRARIDAATIKQKRCEANGRIKPSACLQLPTHSLSALYKEIDHLEIHKS